ncbi:MAG: 5'/3'-nucleotidase SurE [Myxococcota bacterium]
MRVLVSNDDGYDAPGLQALAARLQRDADVFVVAPTDEQSAQSHSLTMTRPLRLITRGPQRWAVTGTPADCIYVALHHVMVDQPPDLVISGINNGSNLGSDVHYSGTVAAAREACLHGYQSIAVSLHREPDDAVKHWDAAAELAATVIARVREHPLPRLVLLNVNVPNRPLAQQRGLKAARLGDRVYAPLVDERRDPRGRSYLWIGGPHLHFGEVAEADGPAVEDGWATVTPLSAAITSEEELTRIRSWTDA